MACPPPFYAVSLLDPARYERDIDGQTVQLFTLRNSRGMVAGITNYGAKIEQLLVPDRHGNFDDVVLGYDSLDGVLGGSPSMGAFVGRYAGRIENACFTLAGKTHTLSANNGAHCLHGGLRGSRFRIFDAVQHDAASVEMRYVFADGEEGFPGTLALRLTYRITEANEMVLDYEAEALDTPGVASFTTHAFFNLDGAASGNAMGHEVMVCADRYLAMDADLIATGELLPVLDTPFDFRQALRLDTRVRGLSHAAAAAAVAAMEPVEVEVEVDGYDCCYLVSRSAANVLALCARLSAAQSGRVMEVWSTEPALQFYTGLQPQQALAGGPGKNGQLYMQQYGICFEPQGYPNAPNRPAFPSAVYEPGQSRSGTTLYRFGTVPVGVLPADLPP